MIRKLTACMLLLGLPPLLASCGSKAPAPVPEAAPQPPGIALSAEARAASGIRVQVAGPATLVESILLYGTLQPNAESVRNVVARFPGVVRDVSVKLGDEVKRGQLLARVESNESLQVYPVTSPIAGVVTQRLVNPGEHASAGALFTITNLSTLWAELAVFPRDRAAIRVGQVVRIAAPDAELSAQGRIVYVSPLGSSSTQALTARALLDNAGREWSPGLYVRGEVATGEAEVPLAVPVGAIQELDQVPTVFIETQGRFEPRPVRLGRNDGRHAEVLQGIAAGDRVVVEGSFVLKAELGKGGAEHEH